MKKSNPRHSFEYSESSQHTTTATSSNSPLYPEKLVYVPVPAMPDIFVWAPEEDAAALNIGPYCAFSSSSSLQYDFDGEPYDSLSEASDDVVDEDENEAGQEDTCSRRKSLHIDTEQVSDGDVVAWTREILQNSPVPSPTTSSPAALVSKSILARATAFIRALTFGNKEKPSRSEPAHGVPSQESTRTRSGTVTRVPVVPGTQSTSDQNKNRGSLFMLTDRNRSATSLSDKPSQGPDFDPSLDLISGPIMTSLSDPCTTAKRPVLRPSLRRLGSAPASLKSNNTQPAKQSIEAQSNSESDPNEQEIEYTSPTTPSLISPADTDCSALQTPIDEPTNHSLSGDTAAKLPSLPHFDSLSFNLGQF